jgi:TadE-like protein
MTRSNGQTMFPIRARLRAALRRSPIRPGTWPTPRWRRTTRRRARESRWLPKGQRGSITVETAVALPALVVVLATALWGVSAAAAQVACVDAARAGARAAARGEPPPEVRAEVLRAAPSNANVSLTRDPVTTRVMVQAEARPLLKGLFPPLKLRAQAIAATEPEGGSPLPRARSE